MLDTRPGNVALAGTILRTTAALAVLTLFVAACGGGDDDPATTSGAGATVTVSTTTAGATQNADALAATGTTTTTSETASVTLTDLAELTSLPSFRWNMTLTGAGSLLAVAGVPSAPAGADGSGDFTAEGTWIAPDQAQVVINIGGVEYGQTIKGGEQWTSVAGQQTGPTQATADAASLLYVSSFVDPESVIDAGSMQCGSNETVNGVDTTRCQTTDALDEQIIAGFASPNVAVSEASFVFWVAESGNYIVKWQLHAAGTTDGQPFNWDFEANITDVNNVPAIDP